MVDQQFEDGNIVLGKAHGLGITVDEALIDSLGGSGGWGVTAGPHVRPERAGRRLVAEASPRLDPRPRHPHEGVMSMKLARLGPAGHEIPAVSPMATAWFDLTPVALDVDAQLLHSGLDAVRRGPRSRGAGEGVCEWTGSARRLPGRARSSASA